MKRRTRIACGLALLCALSLSGCGNQTAEEASSTAEATTIEVATTVAPTEATEEPTTEPTTQSVKLDSKFEKNGISFAVSSDWEKTENWEGPANEDRDSNVVAYHSDDKEGILVFESYVPGDSFGYGKEYTEHMYNLLRDSDDIESVEKEEWISICDNLDCKKIVFKRKKDDGTTYDSHELVFTNGNLNYMVTFSNLSEECIDEMIDSFSMPTRYIVSDITLTASSDFLHQSDKSEIWISKDGKSGGFAVACSDASCESEEEKRAFLSAFCNDDQFHDQEWTEVAGQTAIKYHDSSNNTEYAFIENKKIYIVVFFSDCREDVMNEVVQSITAV